MAGRWRCRWRRDLVRARAEQRHPEHEGRAGERRARHAAGVAQHGGEEGDACRAVVGRRRR
jgi:hypothetical protein